MEHSLAARGDLWRVEASTSNSPVRDDSSSLFLLQLGPLLFLRDSTLLLPVHLSKQHLLWYGYDRKKGMHSLCPALWSKHRRWLMMSMLCLNPLDCSFVDLQFPNGQLTYVSGEGLTTSVFVPLCGGLLQAQGQYPGDMRFSFSCKSKQGTRITPMINWPDKSLALGVSQALAWRRSGVMLKPAIQLSVCSTFGGSNPGIKTEVIQSLNDNINMICGCAFTAHPSTFASVSFGRSKWNGNIGRTGIVVRADTPLPNVARPSFSIQINNAFEF
uniref:At1g53450/T3F20_17 n=2 Tax=Arabidopsis TaxID=3701 RepID=Q8W4R2_ARATH|nr:At1g53450/T3F20_17 [Arabidopsis thaliana]AAN18106.1 At1g53450/T3F20_17 [Arabidopsis thaliana]